MGEESGAERKRQRAGYGILGIQAGRLRNVRRDLSRYCVGLDLHLVVY